MNTELTLDQKIELALSQVRSLNTQVEQLTTRIEDARAELAEMRAALTAEPNLAIDYNSLGQINRVPVFAPTLTH